MWVSGRQNWSGRQQGRLALQLSPAAVQLRDWQVRPPHTRSGWQESSASQQPTDPLHVSYRPEQETEHYKRNAVLQFSERTGLTLSPPASMSGLQRWLAAQQPESPLHSCPGPAHCTGRFSWGPVSYSSLQLTNFSLRFTFKILICRSWSIPGVFSWPSLSQFSGRGGSGLRSLYKASPNLCWKIIEKNVH